MSESGRSVTLDGLKIKRCRKQKGWTAEKLAEESDLSVTAISRAERGLPILVESARALAETLEMRIADLWPDNEPGTSVANVIADHIGSVRGPSSRPGTSAFIKIVTTIELVNFVESEREIFLQNLATKVQPVSDMKITDTVTGSTIITIELDAYDVESVIRAFVGLQLDELQVRELIVPRNTPWNSKVIPLKFMKGPLLGLTDMESDPSPEPDPARRSVEVIKTDSEVRFIRVGA